MSRKPKIKPVRDPLTEFAAAAGPEYRRHLRRILDQVDKATRELFMRDRGEKPPEETLPPAQL